MAIKGLSYSKTSWSFEERPVASSKLNLWDDRIEAAIEMLTFLMAQQWGAQNGVLRRTPADDLAVRATSPVSLIVQVLPGYAFISNYVYRLNSTVQSATIAAPVGNPRRDLVQARLATWDISVKTGTPAASPALPSVDADCLALAEIYCRPSMTSIKDTDDATNGYILDVRQFL